MHLPDKQPERLTELANKLRGQVHKLLQGLDPTGEPVALPHSDNIFAGQPTTRLFLLRSGHLQRLYQGKQVYLVEPGDLVGLSRSLQLPQGRLAAEEPVELLAYDRDRLMAHVNADEQRQKLWTYYLVCASNFYREGLAQEVRSHFQPSTGFLHFAGGETIIQQGTAADCVYTLLEGSAEAVCDGVKVGEINSGEIFGAMAVFTRQKRNASVVATRDCTVMAVRKEDFVDLIEYQPRVCLSLVEEMASKINQLNLHILELQQSRGVQ